MTIAENILTIRKNIPDTVQLVCVSKFQPDSAVLEAHSAGERVFGESKVQELCGKFERLPKDIQWHFIGHLQTNKVKFIVPFVQLIHSVDSLRLLQEIDFQAGKCGRSVDCLLQVHIAREETKFGFLPDEVKEMLHNREYENFKNVNISGLMGMATYSDNAGQIKKEFDLLVELFNFCKQTCFASSDCFRQISMGMSHDYPLAISAGSTMVRVGSSIFGERNW
jgi:pyridoxal phosphate enzyme (YggS family)